MLSGGLSRGRSVVSPVDIGQLDRISGHLLHLPGKCFDLRAVALIGRGHGERDEMAERIDRDVNLRSLAALGSVVAGTGA